MNQTEAAQIIASANISECKQYRYWLKRQWSDKCPIGTFICKNPSKATALFTDQTMGNCQNLALAWGWGGFYIVNLFAYRSTDPSKLGDVEDPVGPCNDYAIEYAINNSDTVILAWGKQRDNKRAQCVETLVKGLGKKPHCIKKNEGGGYLHPSRIRCEDYPSPLVV